jgi:hypothetical protein
MLLFTVASVLESAQATLLALQQYVERLNNSGGNAGKTSVSCIPYVLNIMIAKMKLIMLPACIRFICSLVMESSEMLLYTVALVLGGGRGGVVGGGAPIGLFPHSVLGWDPVMQDNNLTLEQVTALQNFAAETLATADKCGR